MDFGIVGVASITVICWLAGQVVKNTSLDNKWIPCIVGALGGLLGLLGMKLMPEFPAQEAITAFAVGIVSGLGATGADQLVKQLGGNGNG